MVYGARVRVHTKKNNTKRKILVWFGLVVYRFGKKRNHVRYADTRAVRMGGSGLEAREMLVYEKGGGGLKKKKKKQYFVWDASDEVIRDIEGCTRILVFTTKRSQLLIMKRMRRRRRRRRRRENKNPKEQFVAFWIPPTPLPNALSILAVLETRLQRQ